MKAIREVRRQKEGNDAKRGYVVGDAQRRGRRIGGGSDVSLRQNAVSAVISSPTDGWPVVRADQASPSMVQPTGIKEQASPSDISTMPSRPTLMCCPEEIWTAPVPGGALTRTFTGLGGFRFSGSLWWFSFRPLFDKARRRSGEETAY